MLIIALMSEKEYLSNQAVITVLKVQPEIADSCPCRSVFVDYYILVTYLQTANEYRVFVDCVRVEI